MDLASRLEQVYTGAVFDVLRSMGHRACVLPADIRPLDPDRTLAGRIYTVSGHVEEGLDPHETYVQWTGFLSRVPPDTVVVCQANDSWGAHMGELSAETLSRKGVRGYIVDGGCRDTKAILELGFRVWCRYMTPADLVGRWVCDRFEEPIQVGEVTVHTGDYICADRDGVVVIPEALVPDVVDQTEAMVNTESQVRTAILDGVDPQEAYLRFRAF